MGFLADGKARRTRTILIMVPQESERWTFRDSQ